MNKITFVMVSMILLAAGVFSTPAVEAQATIPQGTVELSGTIGLSSGLGSVDKFTNMTGVIRDVSNLYGGPVIFDPGSNTKWNFGASGGYAIHSNLMVVAEMMRTQLQNPTLRLNSPLVPNLAFDASLVEATAGVQYQVPLWDSKIGPFAGFGVGLARTRLALQESTFNVLNLNFSDNHFTFNFGGGARVHISDHWGLRPELKYAHIPGESWVRTSVGALLSIRKVNF